MKRTDANTWYSHDRRWKLGRGLNGSLTLTQVSPGPIGRPASPRIFTDLDEAIGELARIEGTKAYIDEWLEYLRVLESKGGEAVETRTIKITCLACGGRKTTLDTTKTLRGVPVVTCPRCQGTGEETVETAL